MTVKGEKKRGSLTLIDLILFGVANVVGAGIFIILSKSILYGGNKSLHALLTVAVISMIMGFCYIEIYSRYSSSTTEYLAIKNTMGEGIGQITLYTIYLFALLSGVTIVTSIAKYMCDCAGVVSLKKMMAWTDSNHFMLETTVAVVTLFVMAFINLLGIETGKMVANTISVVMLVVLVGVIVLSSPLFDVDKLLEKTPQMNGFAPGSKMPWNNFVLSAVLSLFLYNGYDFLVKISDESADPENNKTALVATIVITTLLYAGIMIAGICVLGHKKAGGTRDIITRLYGMLTTSKMSTAVYISGLFIMFNTGFLSILSAAKFMEGLGNDKKIFMPEFWSKTNRYDAPSNAIWVSLVICVLFALFNNNTLMAILSNVACIFILIMISIALLILRWREKDDVEAQLKHNYIWGNVSNMPVPVIVNLAVLIYIMYEMFKNKFWIHLIF